MQKYIALLPLKEIYNYLMMNYSCSNNDFIELQNRFSNFCHYFGLSHSVIMKTVITIGY